jgi:hypothetical protein
VNLCPPPQPLIGYYEDRGVLANFAGTESDGIYPEVPKTAVDVLNVILRYQFLMSCPP